MKKQMKIVDCWLCGPTCTCIPRDRPTNGRITQENEFFQIIKNLEETTGESPASSELVYLAGEIYLRTNVARGEVVAEDKDFSIWEAQDNSFALWLRHKNRLGFVI